jgi:hypothetical protein
MRTSDERRRSADDKAVFLLDTAPLRFLLDATCRTDESRASRVAKQRRVSSEENTHLMTRK